MVEPPPLFRLGAVALCGNWIQSVCAGDERFTADVLTTVEPDRLPTVNPQM
jgi:hypothetical protein